MSDLKKVKVTGAAAESFTKGTKTRKRSTKMGGAMPSLRPAPADPTPIPAPASAPAPAAAPQAPQPTTAPPPAAPPKQMGGVQQKPVKVVLAPSKKKQSKVILAPPKTTTTATPAPPKTRAKTMKVARRIRMNVDGLSKKLNRAKTIKKESEKMAIEKVKSELVKVGLIKGDSKAPEGILRQMYSDFQMLKQRAL
jgi:hypothetical protein